MKKGPLTIGVDIGTGGCKTTIVSANGRVVSSTFQEYPTACPKPLWSEQDPKDWYNAFSTTLKVALEKGNVRPGDITSICVDGQPHTLVLLDDKNRIIRPAIVWTDQRSAEQSNRLKESLGDLIFKIGYNQVNPTWTISMLSWIRENEPQTWKKISKIMLPKDYIRFKLVGRWATDWTDAAGTLLTDAQKKEWSKELCKIVKLPKEVLPEILPPMEIAGEITKEASKETGVPEGTSVVVGSSDPAAEIFGTGLFEKDQLAIKLATAGVVFVITERANPHPQTFTYPHVVKDMWFSAAGTNSCGSSVKWFRDLFGGEEMKVAKSLKVSPYEIMDAEAEKVAAGSDGLIFHPYLLGERSPYWDPYLRASFTGIRMSHQKRHFIRSVLEGLSFSVKDCLYSIRAIMGKKEIEGKKKAILLGGGSKSKLWSQILSDVLGLELWKLETVDASFGAALIGGVGVSMFSSPGEAMKKCVRISDKIKPNSERSSYYERRFKLYKKIHDVLSDIYKEI